MYIPTRIAMPTAAVSQMLAAVGVDPTTAGSAHAQKAYTRDNLGGYSGEVAYAEPVYRYQGKQRSADGHQRQRAHAGRFSRLPPLVSDSAVQDGGQQQLDRHLQLFGNGEAKYVVQDTLSSRWDRPDGSVVMPNQPLRRTRGLRSPARSASGSTGAGDPTEHCPRHEAGTARVVIVEETSYKLARGVEPCYGKVLGV